MAIQAALSKINPHSFFLASARAEPRSITEDSAVFLYRLFRKASTSERRGTIIKHCSAILGQEIHTSGEKTIGLFTNHKIFADALTDSLAANSYFEVAFREGNPDTFLETATKARTDVVILDSDFINGGVFQLAARLQQDQPQTSVAFIGHCFSDTCLAAIVRFKPAGCFEKSESLQALLQGLRKIVNGESRFPSGVKERIVIDEKHGDYALRDDAPVASLTPLELQILECVALGYQVKEIAAKFGTSYKAVENQKYRMMRRLGLRDRVEATRFAIREGLVAP